MGHRDPRLGSGALVHRAAAAVAVGGIVIAAVAPATWFDVFRVSVIGGTPGTLTAVDPAHRVIAACGAIVAGLAIAVLAARRPSAPEPARGVWLAVAGVPFGGLIAINAWWAGAANALWAWPPRWLTALYVPGLFAFAAVAALGLGVRPRWRERARRLPGGIADAAAAGAAYGCFSALWHCCPPLWSSYAGTGVIAAVVAAIALTVAAIAGIGYVVALSTRLGPQLGIVTGGLLLGVFYPWHTVAWFVHCVVGGAFCTWIARRTGSLIAPGTFLAAAYVTHMTLPFVGWWGAGLALALAVAVTWRARGAYRRPRNVAAAVS